MQVYRKRVAPDAAASELVFEDRDEAYYVSIAKSSDRALIMIDTGASLQNEVHYIRADAPASAFQARRPRPRNVLYVRDLASCIQTDECVWRVGAAAARARRGLPCGPLARLAVHGQAHARHAQLRALRLPARRPRAADGAAGAPPRRQDRGLCAV